MKVPRHISATSICFGGLFLVVHYALILKVIIYVCNYNYGVIFKEFRLIIVNFTYEWSHGRLDLSHWEELANHDWRLYDVLSETFTYREGDRMVDDGLVVDVAPFGAYIYQFSQLKRISRKYM